MTSWLRFFLVLVISTIMFREQTIERCYEAGYPTIPSSDQPTSEEITAFKNSKVDCLLFQAGIGNKQDWNSYRKCILSQDAIDDNDLAEIYANGWGVKRNSKLAIAFVCHGNSVVAELEGMIDTLYSTKDDEHLKKEFDFCNHITSSISGAICESKDEAIAEKKRELEFLTLTSQWTESQKNTFRALQKTASDFFFAHTFYEQSTYGTARLQIAISKKTKLKDAFLQNIKTFELGKMPNDTNFIKVDKDLNTLYSQIMKQTEIQESGTITKAEIKATQRKWIKYRDAWIKFVEIKYPDHSSDVWKTWLTKQRIKQLKVICCHELACIYSTNSSLNIA